MMKYIDIEFENQPVVIPLYHPDEDNETEEERGMSRLIQPKDVNREQRIASIFRGSLIPSSTVWRAASDRDSERAPSNTNRLRKIKIKFPNLNLSNLFKHEDEKEIEVINEYRFVQDLKLNYMSFIFFVYVCLIICKL